MSIRSRQVGYSRTVERQSKPTTMSNQRLISNYGHSGLALHLQWCYSRGRYGRGGQVMAQPDRVSWNWGAHAKCFRYTSVHTSGTGIPLIALVWLIGLDGADGLFPLHRTLSPAPVNTLDQGL
ncbi:hypothetical protein J6590_083067 [Homalodisca vitripennis]|nr:hypothetical protein J6590_083067 [Homalodisca vitripennis]